MRGGPLQLHSQLLFHQIERRRDRFVHVVVFVAAQTTGEDDVRLVLGEFDVLGVQRLVLLVVERIVGLVAGFPIGGILARDDGLGQRVAVGVLSELEMLVLDDAGPGDFAFVVVDDGDALVILFVKQLAFEAEGAVLELAELEVEERVDGPAVDDALGDIGLLGDQILVFDAGAHLDAFQHVGDHLRVAADRDALVAVVEVVVVVGEAAGEALDDGGGQILAIAAPLLLGVALDELFEDVASDQGERLLLEVLGFADALSGDLLVDLGFRLGGGDHAGPHLGERVHVEGHVVDLALVVGDGGVHVVVELGEAVHVVPDVLERRVEDVSAVFVNVDALDLLGVHVARDMRTAIDDEAALPELVRFVREHGAGEAGSHDEIVVLGHDGPFFRGVVGCAARRSDDAFAARVALAILEIALEILLPEIARGQPRLRVAVFLTHCGASFREFLF